MDIDSFLITRDAPISEIINRLNKNAAGIVVVVDEQQRLINTITDGDIRRAILNGCDLSDSADSVLTTKSDLVSSKSISAPVGTDELTILHIMTERRLHQIPLVDEDGRVVDVKLLDLIVEEAEGEMSAVLMAGGFGKRLMPLTENTPKPMLKIGGRPIMEHIMRQLRDSGIGQVNVTTHYRHDQIAEHFGDGEGFGLGIDYVREDNPLGTAGSLAMIERPDKLILVMNGDILTTLNFRTVAKFHTECDAVMTVAVRPYEHTVPYGVMETNGVNVTGVREKPKSRWMINAGIYILGPEVFEFITKGEYLDMPTLMERLIEAGKNVVCFPLHEYWRDIGRPEDFESAETEIDDVLGGQ